MTVFRAATLRTFFFLAFHAGAKELNSGSSPFSLYTSGLQPFSRNRPLSKSVDPNRPFPIKRRLLLFESF